MDRPSAAAAGSPPHRRRPAAAGLRRARRVACAVAAGGLLATLAVGPAVAAATVNLDQWASTDKAWQNGNLNGNNSRYPEGGIVPFRLAMEGLAAGGHSIHINYDVTAGGHKAYDFLATWNVTNAAGAICSSSGGGISSMCPTMPSSSSAAFPVDPFVMDGLSVHGAQSYSAAPRRLTIWGGTILSISAPVHSGPTSGNSSGDMVVRFRSTGRAVLLAWGGHLAQSAYWNRLNGGPSDGAGQVSGSPWHMRTLQLDGAGNKNQDRSIQPSAIVGELPPFALAPPTPPPAARPTAPAAPAPTPVRAPGATPRAAAPGAPAAPATPGSGPGDPTGPGGGSPGFPSVTVPPTSTVSAVRGLDDSLAAGVGAALALSGLVLLALLPLVRRTRPRTRRRP